MPGGQYQKVQEKVDQTKKIPNENNKREPTGIDFLKNTKLLIRREEDISYEDDTKNAATIDDHFLNEFFTNKSYIIKDEENLSYKDIYKELDWKADNIIPEACIEYYVFFRPHYEAFVLFCSQNFHFGVWTAATSDYAQFIVDRFGIKVEYLFYDEHVNMSEELKLSKYTFEVNRNTPIKYYRKQVNHYHKDLSLLRTFLSCSEIAIIDDRKFVHEDQKQNSVYLKAFILVDDKEYDNGKKNIYISENKGVLTLEGFVPVYYDLIVKFYRELNNIKNIKKISYTKINPLYINYDIKYKDQLINFVNNLEDRTLIVVMYILDIWNKTNLMKEYDKPFDKYSLEIPTFIGQYLSKLN